MVMTGAVDGAPSSNIALQPQSVTIVADEPTQVQAIQGGCTVINNLTAVLELCSDQNFTVPVFLPVGASIPWTTGTTLWAQSTVGGTITVLPEPYNYYNPNTLTQPASQEVLLPFQTAYLSNGTPPLYAWVVPLTAQTRTLCISVFVLPGVIPSLAVYGDAGPDGQYRVLSPMYLQGIANGQWLAYVPVSPDVDTQVVVEVTGQSGTGGEIVQVEVYGDPLQYKEDVFYNGAATAFSVIGAGTALTGPARVLTLNFEVGAGANINWGGNLFAQLQSGSIAYPIPPDTILPTGETITTSGGIVLGGLYAYP